MIHILFLMESLTGGGAEKVMGTLINNLDRNLFRVTVQTMYASQSENLLAPGIRYKTNSCPKTRLGKKLFSWWLRLCGEANLLYPLYIRGDYDIEVACLECGATKYLSGSTNRNALKLAWVHCDLEKKGIRPTAKLRRIYGRYDKVICVSDDARSAFLRLFGSSPASCVLPNVTDEQEIRSKALAFPIRKPDVFTFAAVGRLAHQKGFDRLLDACHFLRADFPNFRLVILGEGPERPALEKQIIDLGLQDTVFLAGFTGNPYPAMKAADCIVCSSRYEGRSTVVTEALLLGKAVITTPCAGMKELLGNSQYGLVTEDSAEGICMGMKSLLQNPELLRRYEEAAALRAPLFSKTDAVSEIQNFFLKELTAKRSGL